MKNDGCKRYFRDPWNIFDQLMLTMMPIAVFVRFGGLKDVWARSWYDINLLMFYLRILQLYYIHPRLGPKVIVIWRMVFIY